MCSEVFSVAEKCAVLQAAFLKQASLLQRILLSFLSSKVKSAITGSLLFVSSESRELSLSVRGRFAGVANNIRSAVRILESDFFMRSEPSSVLSSKPAVSVIVQGPKFESSIFRLMGSVVVPGAEETTAVLLRKIALKREDFPAFVLPAITM